MEFQRLPKKPKWEFEMAKLGEEIKVKRTVEACRVEWRRKKKWRFSKRE